MSDQAEQLCELAKAGNVAAASELVTGHYQKIFSYFRRWCGNDEDAADLTQKTFAKVWAALPSFEGRSSFSTWLHGIGRNVYVDWRRKGNRLDFQTDEWWAECVAEGPSPFEDAAERDLAGRLYALVAQLEENAREVVHLHYYQGLSLKETAEVLDIATSTVKYRLREALNVLRSLETNHK
ncbi:MAG TPA: RNA polymerase sigma factor [Verrucomicrobiae bacterium]|nr:RNA polymerase sigma factor [Verrucomicrobiae bacterium]